MALRDKLKERVQPMLEPGEQVQHVFMAQAASPYWVSRRRFFGDVAAADAGTGA